MPIHLKGYLINKIDSKGPWDMRTYTCCNWADPRLAGILPDNRFPDKSLTQAKKIPIELHTFVTKISHLQKIKENQSTNASCKFNAWCCNFCLSGQWRKAQPNVFSVQFFRSSYRTISLVKMEDSVQNFNVLLTDLSGCFFPILLECFLLLDCC